MLLTWEGWAEPVLVVLVLWSPEEVLEVWGEEEEEEEAGVLLRWDNRELSNDCSDK